MKLTYFFKATIRKEQIASAFLATLLHEKQSFREFFFQKAFPTEWETLSGCAWKVEVEPFMVDVRLSSINTVVIIENKVRVGAKQEGQLLRYYQDQKEREGMQRVLVVYLAPRQVGASEVAGLLPHLKSDDQAAHVSWEEVLKFEARGDSDADPIETAFEQIQLVLNDHAKYLHEGDRGAIAEVVDEALNLLRPLGIRLGRWTGREFEEILTNGKPVTVWLDAAFEAEGDEPWSPKNVRVSEEKLRLTVRSQFRLSDRAAKDPQIQARWRKGFPGSEVNVAGVLYRCDPGGRWFKQQREMIGTQHELAVNMATVGRALLEFLDERMEGPNLPT